MPADLVGDFPRRLRSIPNVKHFLEVMEDMINGCADEISHLPEAWMDARVIEARYLPFKLADWGFILGCLDLTEAQMRKLVDGLIPVIYRQKGTLRGIVNLIRLLLGIEVTATIENVQLAGAWRIGVSKIGIDTYIGIDDPASFLLITAAQALTEFEADNMLCLIDFMRVAGTEVRLDYPGKVDPEDLLWKVGLSKIGVSTQIGELPNGYLYENNYPAPGVGRSTFVN